MKIYTTLYFVGLIHRFFRAGKFNNGQTHFCVRRRSQRQWNHLYTKKLSSTEFKSPEAIPWNVPGNWKCLCFNYSSLTMNYHFAALRNGAGKSIPRYNLPKKTQTKKTTSKCYELGGKPHMFNEEQFYRDLWPFPPGSLSQLQHWQETSSKWWNKLHFVIQNRNLAN